MLFKDIIGHEAIKKQIMHSIDNGRFSHASIITGEDGLGKSLIARDIAYELLNKDRNRQCVDIIEARISGNKKSIGVDEIEKLIEEINSKPYEGNKKVIIIYEADKITNQAQNAFLKTIEEPPSGVYIMLLCEHLDSLLDTIRSRCQAYKLHHLTCEEMERFIIGRYSNLNKEEVHSMMAFSDCIPGRAEKYIEDKSLKEIRSLALDILLNIKGKDFDIWHYEDILVKYKGQWNEVLTWFLSFIRDSLIYKEINNIDMIINVDKIEDIKKLSEMFSFNELNDIIDIIKSTRVKLEKNVNVGLVFESMLLDIQEV
ncbi:DNA polymerase III subunit delta' [Clostridium sp. HMP27]|uniref:DNA polymerase III subunit delta' n=1 Tax=Clostridium sp. HMP27 TaxID=1487921 RepID=UPI00052D5224|nr:DNA polymerase III subunit delta' [Clostridium sp. HMP27]KGK90625.1 DNA polymerase III subunit delta' [Clostridium sp. HMP27]